MICGFCPGSGTAHERVFNRADVFKKHLTKFHGVEQAPPNSRKRSSSKDKVSLTSYCMDATGKCSICSNAFSNAQDFYEHLDECVLKVVQQEDPIEAINARALGQLVNDSEVLAIFERNNIKQEDRLPTMDEDDELDDDEEEDDETHNGERFGRAVIRTAKVTSNRPIVGGNISKRTSRRGLTWSKGGGCIVGKSRKRRKFYPPSWGMATDNMNMRKRVLCVYDGQRRLLKDDMMMHNEFEVRMPIADTNHYVTDLDMETIKRANAFHNATEEEKGPWLPDDFGRDGWP